MKVKVLNLLREETPYAEGAKIYGKNESTICEIVEEKEICASFAVAPPTTNVMATVHDKCLVGIERALNLWVEDMSRKRVPTDDNVLHQKALSLYAGSSKGAPEMSDHVHITFYRTLLQCPIVLLVLSLSVASLLQCLIYK